MNPDKETRNSQTRWRSRTGRRIAIAGLSLLALGGGVAVVTQPASASSTPTTATAAQSRPQMMSAGWGG